MATLPDVSRLTFNVKKHAYTLDGHKLLTGVTSVISGTSDKSQLINWSANMAADFILIHKDVFIGTGDLIYPEAFERVVKDSRTAHTKKKESAGSKGTDMHGLVESYINRCIEASEGRPMTLEPLLMGTDPIEPFVNWAFQEVSYFVASEQKLYDEENAVAGTADFFYVAQNGDFVVGDLKTFAKMWSPDAYCQTGQYARMWRLLTGDQATRSVIVKMCDPSDERLLKYHMPAFSVYPRSAVLEDEDIFITRLKLYRYNQNFTSPNF